MTIRMENLEKLTLAEMAELVANTPRIRCTAVKPEDRYEFIEAVLRAQQYSRLNKGPKGIVRRFLAKITDLSRAQLTRLIQRWVQSRRIERKAPRRRKFRTRYTGADIALLAEVDAAHEDLSGPAVRHLLRREFEVYGNRRFERLATISASHIYNLRNSVTYRNLRVRVQPTQARTVSIGERRQPNPKGQPGYLRVDTVHQGHHDGQPGLYHSNSIDTVTQWQVVGCVETISEHHLIPVLEAILHQYPFRIKGFHCDNGSEFLNYQVVKLLNKLLIAEFTKSRPNRSTDNALVEGKNGAVVRKQIGYGPIGAEHAEAFQKFYTAYLNPYLNFHRPCGFATVVTSKRGKQKRVYRHQDYQTPFEKLSSLKGWEKYLKEGITGQMLEPQAAKRSDTEAARRMQKAKLALLDRCRAKQG